MSDAADPVKRAGQLPGLLISVLFSAVVYYIFHDMFWYGPDEGAYAHVAERMLDGEVLSRDVKDIHAGYVNYVNALAMALFGETLLSMRYPLVAMGLVQAALVYLLVAPSGRVMGVAAAVVLTSLSTVQYLNPTANWYALFLTIVLIVLLDRPRESAGKWLELIGFLLITLFLFRQLSGVIVALGVVGWLIFQLDDRASERAVIGRGVLGIMALGLAGYLLSKTEIVGFLLFGIWPLGMLIYLIVTVRISDKAMWRMIGRLCLGGALAFLPLVVYHLSNGSLGVWFHESFIAVLDVAKFNFGWYGWVFALAMLYISQPATLAEFANGLFWFVLLAAPVVMGGVIWHRLYKGREAALTLPAMLFIPPFYGLVAITHYQIPIYLFYGSCLILAGLCVAAGRSSKDALRYGMPVLCAFMAGVALFYQAAQPVGPFGRGLGEIVGGKRMADWLACPSEKCGLQIQREDALVYKDILEAIEQNSGPQDMILALPANPEIYFLSNRRSPVAFYNSALGITNEVQLAAALETIEAAAPKLVLHRETDKYNTPLTQQLWATLKPKYARLGEFGDIVIYRRAD